MRELTALVESNKLWPAGLAYDGPDFLKPATLASHGLISQLSDGLLKHLDLSASGALAPLAPYQLA